MSFTYLSITGQKYFTNCSLNQIQSYDFFPATRIDGSKIFHTIDFIDVATFKVNN